MTSSHRVTDLKKIPFRISKDEAPTPLSVAGLCLFPSCYFIFLQSFSVLSFHNKLGLAREPAFYWVFYFIFPIYPCLFHHMQK